MGRGIGALLILAAVVGAFIPFVSGGVVVALTVSGLVLREVFADPYQAASVRRSTYR